MTHDLLGQSDFDRKYFCCQEKNEEWLLWNFCAVTPKMPKKLPTSTLISHNVAVLFLNFALVPPGGQNNLKSAAMIT